jgi:hypothetical protein
MSKCKKSVDNKAEEIIEFGEYAINKDYFHNNVWKKFAEDYESLGEYLKVLMEKAKIELGIEKYNKLPTKAEGNETLPQRIELPRKELLIKFEKNLQNIGFIVKKSRFYKAEDDIGKLYKFLVNKKSENIKIKRTDLPDTKNKEQDLYEPFENILEEIIGVDENEREIISTANSGINGKWVNPDILVKLRGCRIYYSFELKRWQNIDPVAPHEARNHARHISNYPYVVIQAPKELFEFVIEYTENFQIIKQDCSERGIGLILFDDEQGGNYLKLLDAEYFTPDSIKTHKYLAALKTKANND